MPVGRRVVLKRTKNGLEFDHYEYFESNDLISYEEAIDRFVKNLGPAIFQTASELQAKKVTC
jgi:hypothetical protein